MAISKKKSRPFSFNGKEFLWWLEEEFDGTGNMLSINIVSIDKKFLVKHFAYHHNDAESYLLILGEEFPGVAGKIGPPLQLTCPDFSGTYVDNMVTPRTVRNILEWCFNR